MTEIFKVIFLFFAVLFSIVGIGKMIYKEFIKFGILFWWAVSVTGFVYIQWLK